MSYDLWGRIKNMKRLEDIHFHNINKTELYDILYEHKDAYNLFMERSKRLSKEYGIEHLRHKLQKEMLARNTIKSSYANVSCEIRVGLSNNDMDELEDEIDKLSEKLTKEMFRYLKEELTQYDPSTGIYTFIL